MSRLVGQGGDQPLLVLLLLVVVVVLLGGLPAGHAWNEALGCQPSRDDVLEDVDQAQVERHPPTLLEAPPKPPTKWLVWLCHRRRRRHFAAAVHRAVGNVAEIPREITLVHVSDVVVVVGPAML